MKKSKKYPFTEQTWNTRKAKWREVRDVINRIRPRYKTAFVDEFMRQNYFLQPDSVTYILMNCDNEQVKDQSIIYRTVMRDDFNLFEYITIPNPEQLTITPNA